MSEQTLDTQTTAIDRLIDEGLIGMTVSAQYPGPHRAGRPCSPTTVARWCTRGVRTADGRIVCLEHVRIANRLMTTKAAIVRFIAAQQIDCVGQELTQSTTTTRPPQARSDKERLSASERAERELRRMGI